MLQQLEYDPIKLIEWLKTIPNIFEANKRGKLILTRASKGLLAITFSSQVLLVAASIMLVLIDQLPIAILIFVFTPLFLIIEITVVMLVGNYLLEIKRRPLMQRAEELFTNHQAKRIAVLGSYGKTSMKELLNTVLGHKLKVAMTPGNKNVAISHARWSTTLDGDEDALIIEYGEGEPGDIRRLAGLSRPNLAIFTGLAPNHLDYYKTIEALKKDFVSIADFVDADSIYLNNDGNGMVEEFDEGVNTYDIGGVGDWRVSDVGVDITGTSFKMKRDEQVIKIKSGLLGRHNIGPLCLVAKIAIDFGLSGSEVEAAIGLTKPFEHRMEPRQVNGCWIIDDTYNGNLEGFKSGLRLLGELKAKRKIYVTPGLVTQGEETNRVHHEIGQAIVNSNPDKVVLMQNPATSIIRSSLEKLGYKGEVEIVENPSEYYENIDQFLASGDLILMQNDLPDAYQ